MDKEKLKSLRIKIPISLKEAIDLLKKNNGDIEACEKEFHENEIETISRETGCEVEKARKIYAKFNFNTEKAIDAINQEQRILSIENLNTENEDRFLQELIEWINVNLTFAPILHVYRNL